MEGQLDRSKWKPKDLIVFLNGKTTLLFREEEYEVMVKTPLILFLFRVFPEKPEVEKVHWGYLGIWILGLKQQRHQKKRLCLILSTYINLKDISDT